MNTMRLNSILHAKDVQEYILKQAGIKTSVRKGVGSMKGYTTFRPIKSNGIRPKFSNEFLNDFRQWIDRKTIRSEYEIDVYYLTA